MIGATNFLFTLPALYLIDRAGRKTLLLIGSVGLFITLAGTAAIMLTGLHQNLLLWMLIGFIAAFSFSQGAVIWVYIGEVFPTSVRSKGQGIGSASHWFMNAAIAETFPIVVHSMSTAAPFILFAVMTAVQFVTVLLTYPETKGQTLEELQRRLVRAD